jgi:signal transduction histidine kinase
MVNAAPNAAGAPALDPRAVLAHPSSPPFDPLVGLAPSIAAPGAGHGAFGLATDRAGVRWRVYVLPIGRTGQDLAVVASLERIDATVAGLRELVVLFALGGALVTLLAGWLLAGRALRPVAALTQTARAIARSRSLHERVPVGSRGDELGQLGAIFNEMLASLEQANQAQQRFVADASHELRAPLTAIQANLDLLERQPAMDAGDRQEAVGEAAWEARRLAALVADLLSLARADAGVTLRRRHVELDRVALEALGEARHLVRGQRLEVEALEPAVVTGDPDRLKQLVLILLDNALKYTPPPGRVTLGLRREGTGVILTVRDTGIGIPADDLPHVFERFYRADPARTRDTGGTGLGLPIAQWIAELHGGRVGLTSAVGQGTTATVSLPGTG